MEVQLLFDIRIKRGAGGVLEAASEIYIPDAHAKELWDELNKVIEKALNEHGGCRDGKVVEPKVDSKEHADE